MVYPVLTALPIGQGGCSLVEVYSDAQHTQLEHLSMVDCGAKGDTKDKSIDKYKVHVQSAFDYIWDKMKKRGQRSVPAMPFYLDVFLLTHKHDDHWNLLEYLIRNKLGEKAYKGRYGDDYPKNYTEYNNDGYIEYNYKKKKVNVYEYTQKFSKSYRNENYCEIITQYSHEKPFSEYTQGSSECTYTGIFGIKSNFREHDTVTITLSADNNTIEVKYRTWDLMGSYPYVFKLSKSSCDSTYTLLYNPHLKSGFSMYNDIILNTDGSKLDLMNTIMETLNTKVPKHKGFDNTFIKYVDKIKDCIAGLTYHDVEISIADIVNKLDTQNYTGQFIGYFLVSGYNTGDINTNDWRKFSNSTQGRSHHVIDLLEVIANTTQVIQPPYTLLIQGGMIRLLSNLSEAQCQNLSCIPDQNASSAVTLFSFNNGVFNNGVKYLFTGDATQHTMYWLTTQTDAMILGPNHGYLVEPVPNTQQYVPIYKDSIMTAPHHGSDDTSGTRENTVYFNFINRVLPKAILISEIISLELAATIFKAGKQK